MKAALIPWQEALAALLAAVKPMEWENHDVVLPREMAGRVLARELLAPEDDPAFDRSAMDGYAVRTSEIEPGKPLPVSQVIYAEMVVPSPLEQGTVAKVMTGAPVPEGADAVIPVEQSRPDSAANQVAFEKAPEQEQHVRRRGECRLAGDRVFAKGSVLKSIHAGPMAGLGLTGVPVVPLPKVVLLSTGPELVPHDQQPGPGQIRESNGVLLESLCGPFGLQVMDRQLLPDEKGPLSRAVTKALEEADLVCLSGAVSMGDKDLVPPVLEGCGVKNLFHGVAIKPGKPFWAGVFKERVPVLAFPGNPAAVLVLAHLFLGPLADKLRGAGAWDLVFEEGPLGQAVKGNGRRVQFVPVQWQGGEWKRVAYRGSGDLLAFAEATHLLEIPLTGEIPAGGPARALRL